MNYILKDHLGSINYILDEDGTVAQEMNFDAWGRRRDAQTWTYDNIPTNFMFDRGFTMHEHLNAFKLINMNGRMYDPVIARFLSPDPFVQMPEYSQNFNRYSYVLNNPLRFTDPSGFIAIGDSLKKGQYNTVNDDYLNWLFILSDPNGGEDEAASFSTDYLQFGKSKIPNGVDNPDLIEQSNSKLKKKDNSGTSEGDDLSTANIFGAIGVAGTGIGTLDGSFRITNGSKGMFSPKYYASGWAGGSRARISTYSAAKVGNGISAGANGITTGMAYYQIAAGNQQPITYVDAGVGSIGLASSVASYFYGVQIPYVGAAVAVYGTVRVIWDVSFYLGTEYGPSTWYGNNDYRWFK